MPIISNVLEDEKSALVIHAPACLSAASDSATEGHDGGDDAVDFLGGLLFVGFDVSCWGGANVNVIHHPRQHRLAAVSDPLFKHEFHQCFGERGHVFEALSEGHDVKRHHVQVLDLWLIG